MKAALLLLFGACFAASAIASQNGGFDITGNKNCKPSYCVADALLNPFGPEATECCNYFISGCCTPAQNVFLHNMFIVAIACGVVLLVIIVICCVLCICCCWCCGMLCSGGSGRRLQPAGPQYQQLESPVNNIQVVSSSNVTTHPY